MAVRLVTFNRQAAVSANTPAPSGTCSNQHALVDSTMPKAARPGVGRSEAANRR
jgi:hypothetical protein